MSDPIERLSPSERRATITVAIAATECREAMEKLGEQFRPYIDALADLLIELQGVVHPELSENDYSSVAHVSDFAADLLERMRAKHPTAIPLIIPAR